MKKEQVNIAEITVSFTFESSCHLRIALIGEKLNILIGDSVMLMAFFRLILDTCLYFFHLMVLLEKPLPQWLKKWVRALWYIVYFVLNYFTSYCIGHI